MPGPSLARQPVADQYPWMSLDTWVTLVLSTPRGEGSMVGDGRTPAISIDGSHGTQVGSGNTQNNTFVSKPRLDRATLGGLNSRVAVMLLRRMPHEEQVGLFAGASPGQLSEILSGLLRVDESMAVSILADLDPGRAKELVRPLVPDQPWLIDLPEAALATMHRAEALGWADDSAIGRLGIAAKSQQSGKGYARAYPQGIIYWIEGRTCSVRAEIAEYHATTGGTGGDLGFPISHDAVEATSPRGTKGIAQRFEEGAVYISRLGVHAVPSSIIRSYLSAGGVQGWLGYPLSSRESYEDSYRQRFEGGIVYVTVRGSFSVRLEIAEYSDGWIPISAESDAGKSQVSSPPGTLQQFAGFPAGRMAVYSSVRTGVQRVNREILDYYERTGGPASRLGFPVSAVTSCVGGGVVQMFEGGSVYFRLGSDIVTVPTVTIDLLKWGGMSEQRLGWPVSEEEPIGSGINRIQLFEKGAVVVRGGRREILHA